MPGCVILGIMFSAIAAGGVVLLVHFVA